jgi:hypothetical protein
LTQSYYSFPSATATYDAALKISADVFYAGVKGHLWVPNSNLEFVNVRDDLMSSVHKNRAWFAVSDAAVEGKWLVTAGPHVGTDVSRMIPWRDSEPDGGYWENCAVIWPDRLWAADWGCSSVWNYVIEFECPFGQRFNDQGTACIGKLAMIMHTRVRP